MPKFTVGVIGNPNCGKTTLFNALTGARQKVGNWPGVTVDKKEGVFWLDQTPVTLVDLPGTYSLEASDTELSLDEKIARDFILSQEVDLVLNVVDASNLHRNLYLTTELADMGVPMICAVNMVDVAKRDGVELNLDKLSEHLGFSVTPIVAATGKGLSELKARMTQALHAAKAHAPLKRSQPDLEEAICSLGELLPEPTARRWSAQQLLDTPTLTHAQGSTEALEAAEELKKRIEAERSLPIDVVLADSRYTLIEQLLAGVVQENKQGKSITERIDSVVLSRFFGIPFFFFVMYLMFVFAINVGGAFIDFFDLSFAAVFVDGFAYVLESVGSPDWLTTLLANGLGGGIQLVATFIPVIAGLYLFLSVIEDSGYMARAAFVMDRFMRQVGLPGKSFVPLIVGFGCNVPAVMAARTMDSQKDRLLTIAMAPFMSCGARLSVYALFAAAFFESGGALMVFSLYLLGIFMALVTGMALKHTLFKPELTPFVMELPSYHVPTVKGVLIKTWEKLSSFVMRAGKTIVVVVVVLSFLNSIGTDGSFGNEDSKNSVLSKAAQVMTPALSPMGVQADNWPATVGVITGVFAKEAVVGTLDALYTPDTAEDTEFSLWGQIKEAFATVPENLAGLADALFDPLGLSLVGADQTEEQGVHNQTFSSMSNLFVNNWTAYSYLVFVLLYTPCVATLGAMTREAGLRWMLFVAGWTTGLAYTTAVIVYQLSQLGSNTVSALAWILGCLSFIGLGLWQMRRYGQRAGQNRIDVTQI